MKIKLTKDQIEEIVKDPVAAQDAQIKVGDPWWLIVLKVIGYVIGLITAGVATSSCAYAVGII